MAQKKPILAKPELCKGLKLEMRIGAVIQARMSSKRLPGKVLRVLNGKPILHYLLERLSHSKNLTEIVVATSDELSDIPIVEFCKKTRFPCFRGPLENVAKRFYELLNNYNFKAFVRINGDSPLLDQRLVDLGIKLFLDGDYDIVTNVLKRTYPKGQSVEIINSKTFIEAFKYMREKEDLEHVTRYFYRNKDNYRIYNFESGQELGYVQLAVDTHEDMGNCNELLIAMNKPHWDYGYKDLLDILETKRGKSQTLLNK